MGRGGGRCWGSLHRIYFYVCIIITYFPKHAIANEMYSCRRSECTMSGTSTGLILTTAEQAVSMYSYYWLQIDYWSSWRRRYYSSVGHVSRQTSVYMSVGLILCTCVTRGNRRKDESYHLVVCKSRRGGGGHRSTPGRSARTAAPRTPPGTRCTSLVRRQPTRTSGWTWREVQWTWSKNRRNAWKHIHI